MSFDLAAYIFIAAFGCAAYVLGVTKMIRGWYRPSTFSRVVWLLIALVSFVSVIASNSSMSSLILTGVVFVGSLAMAIVSLWKGDRGFARTEIIALVLLVIAGIIWFVFDAPLVTLAMSLLAHLVGGLPTFKRVWFDAASEDTWFWLLFLIGSIPSIFVGDDASLRNSIAPIYFSVFNAVIVVLSLRYRILKQKTASE